MSKKTNQTKKIKKRKKTKKKTHLFYEKGNLTKKNNRRLAQNVRSPRSLKNRIFNKKHYNANDGMLTYIWGPSMWHYLHTVSFNYPVNPTKLDKKYYKQLITNLIYTLPCKYCRINLKNNLKSMPLLECNLKNRETFSKYVYKLHELVNKMLGKKSKLSYCDIRERYEHFRARCVEKNKKKTLKHIKKHSNKTRKREKGCTDPLYGKKSKCVIHIVPKETKCKTFNIDEKCLTHK